MSAQRIKYPRTFHCPWTLEKSKEIYHTMRYVYGNTAIDIQGGEPTIHPDILDMIRYCNEIGLYPTLITNGIHLFQRTTTSAHNTG